MDLAMTGTLDERVDGSTLRMIMSAVARVFDGHNQ
jgi:hypothetical protein